MICSIFFENIHFESKNLIGIHDLKATKAKLSKNSIKNYFRKEIVICDRNIQFEFIFRMNLLTHFKKERGIVFFSKYM